MVKTIKHKRNTKKMRKTRRKKNGGGQTISRSSLLNDKVYEDISLLDDFTTEHKDKLEGFNTSQIVRIFVMSLEHHSAYLTDVAKMYRKLLQDMGVITELDEKIKMPVRGEIDEIVVEEVSTPPREMKTPPRDPISKVYENTPTTSKLEQGELNKKPSPIAFPSLEKL